jgi:hypothetical protein
MSHSTTRISAKGSRRRRLRENKRHEEAAKLHREGVKIPQQHRAATPR